MCVLVLIWTFCVFCWVFSVSLLSDEASWCLLCNIVSFSFLLVSERCCSSPTRTKEVVPISHIAVLRSLHWLPVCRFIKHISDLLLCSDPSRTSEVVRFRSALSSCSQNLTWRSSVQFYEAHIWNKLQKPAGLLDSQLFSSTL